MTVDEYVDAEVVHDVPHAQELAVRHQPTGVLQPIASPDEVRGAMLAYQETVTAILDPSDYQAAGKDKHGNPKQFVKKSGFRKLAKAFGLSVEILSSTIERDADGSPLRAAVVARAIAPNGQAQDGDGYCDVAEERFENARSRVKLENDLRATATTRAKNRAISDLVGMGEVSAEEMQPAAPLAALMLDEATPLAGEFKQALGHLVGDPAEAASIYKVFRAANGGIPLVAANLVVAIHKATS